MPYLVIHTNKTIDVNAGQDLVRMASSLVAEQLRKPEKYVMVELAPGRTMFFAGDDAPLAYLELKSIGLPEDKTAGLSDALCNLVSEALAIDQSRIYIEFTNAANHMWGWNGGTF